MLTIPFRVRNPARPEAEPISVAWRRNAAPPEAALFPVSEVLGIGPGGESRMPLTAAASEP
jgi:hypothetical protein